MLSNMVSTFAAYPQLTQVLMGYFEVWNHDVINSVAISPLLLPPMGSDLWSPEFQDQTCWPDIVPSCAVHTVSILF